MGSWDETCAITSVPIAIGDRVVMITESKVNVTFRRQYPDAGMTISDLSRDMSNFRARIGVMARGKYNDYGWVDPDCETMCGELPDNPNEDDKDGYRPSCHTIFFLEEVWNEIQKHQPDPDDMTKEWLEKIWFARDIETNELYCPEAQMQMWKVLQFASSVRANIDAGKAFRGSQFDYDDTGYKKLAEMKDRSLKKLLARLD